VDHVDFVFLQVLCETPNLASGMKIVKTVESKFRDVVKAEPLNLVEQHSTAV
jgi:hypothetical protein